VSDWPILCECGAKMEGVGYGDPGPDGHRLVVVECPRCGEQWQVAWRRFAAQYAGHPDGDAYRTSMGLHHA